MGTIHLPDPNPGRCRNIRILNHPSGDIEHLRCLDYEATVHVCVFPTTPLRPLVTGGFNSYSPTEPKAWVKPDAH